MYDIFFIIYDNKDLKDEIRSRFPLAKFCIIDEDTIMQEVLQSAQKRSLTKMFWVVDVGYKINKEFMFDYDVPVWDQQYVHVFKEEKRDNFEGVYLIPKNYRITKNEVEHMFFINKKEIPIIASTIYDYEVFVVTTYNDYLNALKTSITELFYVVYSDLKILKSFKFDYTVDKTMKHLAHVFRNGNFYDGIFITSKNQKISEREFNNRFLVNRTEVDIEASQFENFEIIKCNSYDDYIEKIKSVKTSMAYVITSNLNVINFTFEYQVSKWNQDKIHVFKNGEYFDGICLFPTNKIVSKKEFEYKFFLTKIEVDIEASMPKLFDIVFISYNEPNADYNYQQLIKKFPRAKRVHGVKGIHEAHKKAATLVDTPMFWVVDGDAQILDGFNFDYQVPSWDYDVVHVFRSKNPINDLEYGYGGVKLLPTVLLKEIDVLTVDMTTSISSKFKVIDTISNISCFNTDEFSTWRSAFRECVKLSSKIIPEQIDTETLERLEIWCAEGEERKFGLFSIAGAKLGKEYGSKYKDDPEMLIKINDWQWLKGIFQKEFGDINV